MFLRLTSCTHRCLLTTPSPKRPSMFVHIRPPGPAPARGSETVPELSTLHVPRERSARVLGGRDGVVAPLAPVPSRRLCRGTVLPPWALGLCLQCPAAARPPPPSPASAPLPCSGLARSLHTIPSSAAEDPDSSACTFLVGCEDSFPWQEFSECCFRITPLRPQSDRDSLLYMC